MNAVAMPPPKYDRREGCAALGGLTTQSSPRCFTVRVDVTVCRGYAEMEGGRWGGTLRRLFTGLGRPQAEYGACPGAEPEADPGRVRPELQYRRIDAAEGAGKCGHGTVNATYCGGRRRSPEGGTMVCGEEPCGDGCGVQGEGRGREIACLAMRDTAIVWRELRPCLNPLG
ncbi:MAG: hypothetical protein LBF74_10895, partial [Treponema sp.]|nr:hypothetical protein [Treponema sp.]